ncbi:hypothetical protein BDQ12DRAFT_577994, partial [Crucibulum laeve]
QCENCKKKGHLKGDCFAKGGGKENEAPDWWKKKTKSANVADKNESDNKNYAFLVYGLSLDINKPNNSPPNDNIENHGIIIDCGASSHFLPDRSKLLNYQEIPPEPV